MAAGRGIHMEERPVLILADYGRVELTLRELLPYGFDNSYLS